SAISLHVNITHARLTLFPYTTLFRSAADVDDLARLVHHRGAVVPRPVLAHRAGGPLARASDVEEIRLLRLARDEDAAVGSDEVTDRKSTRLNSSHVSISYAVFCLNNK